MNRSIQEPIIVYEHGDVLVFTEKGKAESYLEPVDVLNNEYVAYDSTGLVLKLRVVDEPVEHVVIGVDGPPERQPELLTSILRRFFSKIGIEQRWIAGTSLPELVERALEFKMDW